MNATLGDCCARLAPSVQRPQRLDLNCMALPAGKDVLAALLALAGGDNASGAPARLHQLLLRAALHWQPLSFSASEHAALAHPSHLLPLWEPFVRT